MAKQTLVQRIGEALGSRTMSFGDLAQQLFPDPKSWRYQRNGGPPGCFMALSAAIRRGGFLTWSDGASVRRRMVRAKPRTPEGAP